jgi:3',5'-cyclic AMP phosphodiesterase CpdA
MAERIREMELVLATLIFGVFPSAVVAQASATPQTGTDNAGTWNFAVSGDSRNCGDVVMPAIAAGAWKDNAAFYWHLGDFRKNSDFDEDIQHQPEHIAKPLSISGYQQIVWDDFIQSQLVPFGTLPVFLGIGNHETVWPHTREMYLVQFADWLDTPMLRRQRLSDDGNAHKLSTYYHWIQNDVDFITLDNAVDSEFDEEQLKWFEKILQLDASNTQTRTIVVGMHEALPDSIAENHAMDATPAGIASGRRVYADLLKAQNDAHKHVYVIASHQHFYMAGIFNTEYWRANGGILPGWIVGSAGAVRYALPPHQADAIAAETNVYGFLLGTVKPDGEIDFRYQHINESDVPAYVVDKYKQDFVHWCFAENSSAH